MQKVIDHFMKPLKPFFDDPKMAKGGTVEEFYAGVAESLVNFSETVLDLAVQKVKEHHKYRTFPQVADCIGYCRAARDELYGKTIANAPPKEPYPEWTKERQIWAANVLCGDQGRRYSVGAAKTGWIVALWDFVREKERLPNDREADKVRENHRNRERWFEQNGVGQWGEMRRAMLKRKGALSKMALKAQEESDAHRR